LADLAFIQFSVNGLDDDNGIVDDNTNYQESWQITALIENYFAEEKVSDDRYGRPCRN
jgi:hypothetical protein